eukprot:1135-Heterococcus_DN1.PRE.3
MRFLPLLLLQNFVSIHSAVLAPLLTKAYVVALTKSQYQLGITYAVLASDEWNEQHNVCYWVETYSASLLVDAASYTSHVQCLSSASGNFTVAALVGDTLQIHAAVVQFQPPSNAATVISEVALLKHLAFAPPALCLEQLPSAHVGDASAVEITFHVINQNAAHWNEDMTVCYWVDTFLVATPGLQSRTAGQCLAGPTGTFEVERTTSSVSQISAAVVKRGATVINKSTMLSEVVSLTLQSGSHSGNLPVCRSSEHIKGYWKPIQAQNKSFVCCESDDEDHVARSKYCGHIQHHRKFDLEALDGNRRHAPYYMHAGEHSCKCDIDQDRLAVSQRESYIWTPHACRISEWNAHSFCRHLGTRTMLFIGDSTMYQTAVTVTNMLVAANATCTQQVSYALSDTLVDRGFGYYNRGRSLLDILQPLERNNSSIIVISAGAHVYHGFESLIAEVAEAIQRIRSTALGLTFVWRTQQPGYRLCGLATTPSQYIQEVRYDH